MTEVSEPTDVLAGPRPSTGEVNASHHVQQDYEQHSDIDVTQVVQDEAKAGHEDDVDDASVSGHSGDELNLHILTQLEIDMGNCTGCELTSEKKMFIAKNGPGQSIGPFPIQTESRSCFCERYCNQVSKCCIEVKRDWICYAPTLNKVYCQPCWPFAVGCSESNTFISGYDDWRHLSRTVKVHQESKAHLEACKINENSRANETTDDAMKSAVKAEETYWRQFIERIAN